MLGRLLVATAAVSLLAGCTTAAPPPTNTSATGTVSPAGGWTRVELPDGVRAASLAAAGDQVLVGGFAGSGAAGGGQTPDDAVPSLLVVRSVAVEGSFQLRPAEPYAEVATLESLAVAGDEVFAIGKAVGGAHANPRLSVWDGSLAGRRLTSRPQEFFTFGGHDAGPLLGTTKVGGTPVIFGSRVATTGLYGVVWTRKGHTWTQQAARPELTSSPDREFSFLSFARLGDSLVVAGDELGLAGGLNQSPVAFVGAIRGGWRQVGLPVPGGLTRLPGQLSRATSIACPEEGDTCWTAGWVRGHPLAWPLRVAPAAAGDATVLPGDPPAGDAAAVLALAAGRPVVFTNAAAPTVQLGCPDGWRTLPAPAAPVSAAVVAGGGLFAVSGDALWRLAVPTCG